MTGDAPNTLATAAAMPRARSRLELNRRFRERDERLADECRDNRLDAVERPINIGKPPELRVGPCDRGHHERRGQDEAEPRNHWPAPARATVADVDRDLGRAGARDVARGADQCTVRVDAEKIIGRKWRLLKVTRSERANGSPTHLGRTTPFRSLCPSSCALRVPASALVRLSPSMTVAKTATSAALLVDR